MPMTKAKSSFIVKYELVNGDTAATNIAVSGITTDDILVHVKKFDLEVFLRDLEAECEVG